MTDYAFDGAYARDLDAMVAHGAIAVTVYLTGKFAVPQPWVAQIHARGLGVAPNYEQAPDELVYCGLNGGVAVGQRAMAAAIALGIPSDESVAILFSIDVNVPSTQFDAVGKAFDGINQAIHGRYLADAYGEGALIDYLIATGRIRPNVKGWLSGSSSFPGFNPASPHVGLVQLVGSPVAGTDQDRFTDPAGMHIWWPAGSPYATGDDMTPEQDQRQKDIYNMLARLSFGLDNGGPVPFSQRGELTDRLRTIDGNSAAQPPTADVIAGAVATKIPPFPIPPTADAIGQAAAQHVAASNAEAIIAGILAQLPTQPTKEEIAAATRAELAANPLKLS